jgi:hypothetical protein
MPASSPRTPKHCNTDQTSLAHLQRSLMWKRSLKWKPSEITDSMGVGANYNIWLDGRDIHQQMTLGKMPIKPSPLNWLRNIIAITL